jgi:hypothetical protein
MMMMMMMMMMMSRHKVPIRNDRFPAYAHSGVPTEASRIDFEIIDSASRKKASGTVQGGLGFAENIYRIYFILY